MFEEMNKELEELQLGIARYNKISSMLTHLKALFKEQEENKKIYEQELLKEEVDVEKLNRNSLTSLFYTILGSKEEQMEKERREVLAAKLKLDNILSQIDDTKYQISKLETEKLEVSNCETKYNQLFQKKYYLLKENNSKSADRIAMLEQEITNCKANRKEIEEAIAAGNKVVNALQSTEKSLDSAHGWGVWDMVGGGGLITNMIKHSHIDDAKDEVSRVQSLLSQFRTELTDIKITSDITINIDGFTKFADFFFDGLISDWVVQSKINNSLESVKEVSGKVNTIITKLQSLENNNNSLISQYEDELNSVIEREL